MSRVVLAMSGGVDSSVAAFLLQQAGHEVFGLFMKHGENSAVCQASPVPTSALRLPVLTERLDHKQGCCSAKDALDARRVADRLDIPFFSVNFEREFGRIMDYFAAEYAQARTPNPCVQCNNWLKFGKLFEYADQVGAEFVATGHYARIGTTNEGQKQVPALLRGVDREKDQAYVLFGIERKLLSRILLPVGDRDKSSIRHIAKNLGLNVAEKKDSQEICFVQQGEHAEFVRRRLGQPARSGNIVTTTGELVGTHQGIEAFTIGQRRGVGVAMGIPHYVVRIDADTQTVVIGPKAALAREELTARDCNWLVDPPPGEFACECKIRYNSPPVPARATLLTDGRLQVRLQESRDGVAPGQAAVLFQGEQVLGGGWIE